MMNLKDQPNIYDTTYTSSESFKLLEWIDTQIKDAEEQVSRWRHLRNTVDMAIDKEFDRQTKKQL